MKSNNKKKLASLTVLSTLAGGGLALKAFVDKTAQALLYRHHRDSDHANDLSQPNAKNVFLKTDQGLKLRGILLEEEEAKRTLVILHPFALEARDMELYVPFFKKHIDACNILLIDATAHGQSDGYIRGFGIKDVKDVLLWNKFILNHYGKNHEIILYGKEAGANTILNAASSHKLKNVKAIISDGAFTSPYDILAYRLMKDYKVAKFPTMQLIKRKIIKEVNINIKDSTINHVKHNDIPTIYVQMKDDDFVPLSMVYPLYNANRGSKELFILKDERYLYELEADDEYSQTLNRFLDKYI